MSRRTPGTVLLGIPALLYSMSCSNVLVLNRLSGAIIALVTGIIYLVWAEIEAWRSGNQLEILNE